jgi:hypothetical protein
MQTMKRITQIGLIFLLTIAWVGSSAQTGPVHFKETSVCTVLKHRLKFSGLFVTIRAGVLADGMHGIILIDGDCPDQGLPLDFPQPNADQSVSDFEKLISSSGTPGTAGRRVTGTFWGRLKRDASNGKIYYSLLSVHDVQSSSSAAMPSQEADHLGGDGHLNPN